MEEKRLIIPENLIQNDIDPIDILILNKLHDKTYGWDKIKLTPEETNEFKELKSHGWKREGASITTLHVDINRLLQERGENIKFTRSDIEKRIAKLYEKKIIKRLHALITNPVPLFDDIFHVYLKIPISSELRKLANEPLNWWKAVEKIWEIDKTQRDKNGKIFDTIRMLGIIEGTGEYDIILLIYTNDINQFSEFLKILTEMNYIEKSMTQRVWNAIEMQFDPIKIPDYFEYKESLKQLQDAIKNKI